MAQALQLRRRDRELSAPGACPDCLRRSWLLAQLGPYIEKIATGAPGSRSPELLRLSNEDLVAVAARKVADQLLGAGRGDPRAAACAASCWRPRVLGLLPPRPALPGRAARRRRRALGADRPRRPGAARRGSSPIGGGDGRRRPPRQLLRPRGGARAGARAGGGRAWSWSAASPSASTPAPTAARSSAGPHRRGPRLRRRRRLPGRPPLALAADLRARPGPLRAAARDRRLALDLPGPQPDHGGAGGDDRRRRGGGALGLADHRRPRRGPRPRPRRRARARSARALSAGPNDLLAGGACLVRDAQDVLDAMLGPGAQARSSAPGRRWSRRWPTVLAAVESGRGAPATRSPPRSTSRAPRPPRRSRDARAARLRQPARWSGSTRGRTLQARPASRLTRWLADRSRRSSRSPARTPAAAPASRPT